MAILGASNTHFKSIIDAVEALTQIELKVEPSKDLAYVYDVEYHKFLNLLLEKEYINKENHA